MGVRERYEQRQKEGKSSDYSGVKQRYMAKEIENVGSSITNRVNTWLKNHNTYISNYQTRNSGRKYNYEDSYVSDSADWLNTVSQQKSAFDAEADSILSYMDQYKDYLNADWMAQVRKTLTDARGAQDIVLGNTKKDNEWWSSFGSEEMLKAHGSAEEAYKANQRYDGYSKKYSGQKYEDIQKALKSFETNRSGEIAIMESDLSLYKELSRWEQDEKGEAKLAQLRQKYGTIEDLEKTIYEKKMAAPSEEEQWLTYYQDELYKGDSTYNSKAASGWKSYEAQKIAEWKEEESKTWFDKALESFATTPADTSLPNAGLINAQVAYTNDTTYREPNDEWSTEQKNRFGYLWTEDKQKAYAYAEQVNNQINAKKKYDQQQAIGAAASDNFWSGVGHTLGAIVTAPTGIVDYLDDIAEYTARGTITQKEFVSPFEYSQAAQSGIANKLNGVDENGVAQNVLDEDIPIIGGKGWGDIYSLGVSTANSMLSALAFGGAGTLVNFIGQGGAAGVDDALSRGATAEQALMYGTIVGSLEGLTEMIPAEKLIKAGSSARFKNWLKKALQQGVGEFFEEGASSFFGNLADDIIMRDKSNYNLMVKQLMQSNPGMSAEEASKIAFKQMAGDIAYDAIGGAVSGFVSGGITGAVATAVDARKGNQLNIEAKQQYGGSTDALIQEGLQNNPNSESYQLAQKYQKQVEGKKSKDGTESKGGKELSGFQIRNLLAANQEQTVEKTKSLAKDRLKELGENNSEIYTLADLVTKQVYGQELTRSEKSTLARSNFGAQVAKEITDSRKLAAALVQAAKEASTAHKSLTDRVGEESNLSVSESGQTMVRETGEAFDIKKAEVATLADGRLTFKEAEGREVSAEDIDFADENQSFLVSAVSNIENITPAAATAIMHDVVDTSKPLGGQLNGIDEAYSYGFHGYSVEDMKAGNFVPNLSDVQMMSAYKLGQSARKISDAHADAPVVKMRTALEAKLTAKQKAAQQKERIKSNDVEVYFEDGGTVVKFDEHTGKYDDKRMAAVNTAKFLSKLGIGGKYYFYESYENAAGERVYKDADGKEAEAPNGMYKDADGSIHIDLNAGNAGQGTALFTLGHELTHFIKAQSRKQFKVLGDLVKEAFDKTDLSMNDRVLAKQKFLEGKRGKDVSYTEAYEEVVADAMSTMLTDGSFHEKIMEIKVKDKGLFNTIKRFFEKMIAKFRKVYEELTPDQQDAQDIRELKDMFDRIQTAFAEALVEASENFQASEKVLAESGIVVNTKTESGSLLSVRDVLSNADREKVAKALSNRFNVTVQEAKEWLKAETSLASLILNPKYSAFLDYEADPNEVAIKQNSDYPQGTVDFSNICKKRREFTQVMNRILRNFPNHVFAATDLAKIRTIMGEEGMTLPCGICYVEDRRQLDTIVAQDFIESLKLYREGSKNRPDGKPFNANQLKGLQLTDGDTYVPSIYELVSLEGRNSLKAKNPNMEAAWVKFNNARGMQAVRLLTNEAEYKRQILKYTPKTVQTKNDYGGLRIYSFSDAEMFHLIDIVQVLTDCAAVGLKVQGYTKVNEYAKAVKDTGEKLNRSLIPKGDLGYHMENGKVVLDYDPVEGIDINSEDFFDSKDNPNVGNIVIGINPTQIRAAMVSDFIDYIIPFHTGQSAEVLGEKGIAAWVNYKDSQSEVDLATGKKSAHQINIYTEVFQAAENEGKPIRNKRDFVNKFLAVCKENGLKPRFAEFLNTDTNGDYVYTEGYHKFLVDFKTFAQTEVGEYLPQMPVKPIFDNGYITGLLETYVEEQQVKDAEVAKQMPKVIERITNEIVKPVKDGAKKSDRDYGPEIGILYSDRSVTSWDIAWDSDNHSSLKSQMIAHQDEINAMSPVTEVVFDKSKGKTYAAILNDILRNKFGYRIERQDGATFLFDETAIGTLRHYVTSDEEAAAVIAAPYVLKRGKAISGHKNHKGNRYPSVTYAAPVTINGDRVNVGVAVLFADKDRPHSLRVLMPSGKEYVMQKIKTDPGMEEASPKGGVPSPTGSVSNKKVSQPEKKVKKNSDRNSERGEGASNRHLLANAFEGISQNSIEYKMIQEYKGFIAMLNKLDEDLSAINAEIRKIRFGTEGARDMDKLRALEEKAQRIAKGINRYDKRLLNMEASEPLRKVIERERKKAAQKAKDHVKEIQQTKQVRAEQTELRHKIRKTIRDLDKLLNRGNKKLNVKEDVQNVVTKALQSADILFTDNYGTYDMLRNGIGADLSDAEEALVATCTRMLQDLDKMPTDGYDNFQARQEAERKLSYKMSNLKDVFARERKRLNSIKVSTILGELADAYASLEKSEQSYVQGAYTEAVHNFLKSLQSEVGGTIVRDMTKDQLEYVYAAYKMVLNTVHKANEMFNKALKMSREQMSNAVIREVANAGGVHGRWTKAELTASKADWNNMKPIWVANHIGSDTFGILMKGLFEGQYNFAVDVEEAKQFKLSMDEKYKPRSWDAEKLYEFESSTGKAFSLNLQQIMSLYAFSRREQAYSHLLNGGFVFEENSTVIVEENGRKKTYIYNDATAYKLNETIFGEIIASLTEEQKAYVDEMQKYLSEVMGAKGNEVSMQLYGIKMFKEQFYFPLRSSGAYLERAKEAEMKKQQGQINLVNSGFTHAVKPEAKNPIILSGFMDVWAEHCNEMSMYHSMVLPMEDFRKVYNYSTRHDDKFDSTSVFQTIKDAYGEAATSYIDQLYRELNAGATIDPRETTFKKLISNFKKTAVMLSASVVVQQFSSIGRAYALIDPKYFIGTRVNSDTQLSAVEEMKKYAPVAIIKEMGGFDTGTKGGAKSYIMAEQYGKGERLQGLLKDEQYRSDLMGILPAKADEKTWCAIWEAVKRETKAKHPKMDVKSEEFLKLAGGRFSEVIEKTQVYDSVLARSANMRSKTGLMQMATSFMAEPTTTVNLLEDAIRRGDKKYMARAFGAVAVSIVLNNALASIVYAMRDDDEDETFIEKYFQSFTSGMIDDINPMSYYPFLKDVYSIFQGYDVERADMSVIADLRDALKKAISLIGKDTSGMDDDELAKHYKTVNSAILSLLDAGCSVFGVPLKNVRRDANGIINAWNTVSKDLTERDTSWNSFWDKVGAAAKDTIPIYAWTKDEPKQDKLYEAIVSGDKAYLARLKSTYKTDSAYQSAVRKALRENDSRIHEAAQAKYEGRTEEYKRIFREIQKEGKFSFDDIMSAVNSEESAIRNKLEPDKATSSYTASDFVESIVLGDSKSAEAMKEDIIATKVANGKTQAEAEKEFISSVATGIRDAYSSGLLDEAGAEKMLMEYADNDEEEAASKVGYWGFCEDNPKYDYFTESNVKDYREFAEPENISLEVYAQFINGTKGLADIKDKWGDVEVTKREQVLEVIDSLPLTWQQKDALYLAAGYSESKIWDVPW